MICPTCGGANRLDCAASCGTGSRANHATSPRLSDGRGAWVRARCLPPRNATPVMARETRCGSRGIVTRMPAWGARNVSPLLLWLLNRRISDGFRVLCLADTAIQESGSVKLAIPRMRICFRRRPRVFGADWPNVRPLGTPRERIL
jgi:hypothetical protein